MLTRYRLYSLSAVLVLTALACSGLSGVGDAPTPTLFAPAANNGGGQPAAGSDALTNLSGLSSYKAVFTINWSGKDAQGNPAQGTVVMNQEATTNPPAQHMIWDMSGVGTNTKMSKMEMFKIGDKSYTLISAQGQEPMCTSMMDTSTQKPILSPEDWLKNTGGHVSDAQQLPDEIANGVNAHHYRLTQTEVASLEGLNNYTQDIWTAVDGGYVVKLTVVGDGKLMMNNGGEGHMEMNYDVTDINVPITIEAPTNCQEAGGGDFPRMADATDVASIGQMLTYKSASSAADVAAFYTAQLPAQGWTAGSSQNMGGTVIMEFTKDGKTAAIMLSTQNGATTVMITFK